MRFGAFSRPCGLITCLIHTQFEIAGKELELSISTCLQVKWNTGLHKNVVQELSGNKSCSNSVLLSQLVQIDDDRMSGVDF